MMKTNPLERVGFIIARRIRHKRSRNTLKNSACCLITRLIVDYTESEKLGQKEARLLREKRRVLL